MSYPKEFSKYSHWGAITSLIIFLVLVVWAIID